MKFNVGKVIGKVIGKIEGILDLGTRVGSSAALQVSIVLFHLLVKNW